MPAIPRLDEHDTALLVVDVQERLMPTLASAEALVENVLVLVEMAEALGLPAIVTEQYPRGLGPTVGSIARRLGPSVRRVTKSRFSALVPEVEDALGAWRRSEVLVCGIEAHVCVLQTVLDLTASGRTAFVATDAVTAGQTWQIAPALRRMERAGAVPTGVLSAMYELLGTKEHPAFATCLALAKRIRPLPARP